VLQSEAAGFVLAGGGSTRMGADKALVEFRGRPMIAHALDILREAGQMAGTLMNVSIAGARSDLGRFAPVIEDESHDIGPLCGICRALEFISAANANFVSAIFLSVDQPLMPPSLIVYLMRHAEITGRAVTLASVSGSPQPFPAVVLCAALPVLRTELAAGRRGCLRAFAAASAALGEPVSVVPAELLVQCCQVSQRHALPAARWFSNLNTPPDLGRAEAFRQGA
jgi:molybdopterin-guanine dinucleotide biosynthesis protein A